MLLVVELTLLVPTLLLLVLGRKEHKGRQHLLEHLTNTGKMLARLEYFHSVESAMRSATVSIVGSITGSPPKSFEEDESVQRIVSLIQLCKGGRSSLRNGHSSQVEIRYLMPKFQNRLGLAYRYREAGAEVKFHPGLIVTDLRYIVVDDRITVIGLPAASGENQPTKEGHAIASESLAAMCTSEFYKKWSEAVDYDKYGLEVLRAITSHNPSASLNLLSAELLIPESEVQRILASSVPQNEQKEEQPILVN
ncbi:MAG: hypothetical protein ACYCQJ_04970 [Nitrososphaerales archaeon]